MDNSVLVTKSTSFEGYLNPPYTKHSLGEN